MPSFSPWSADRAQAIIDQHRGKRGALLPILHALQEVFGYIDEAAVPLLAQALNLSRAEVHGVITFYHDFRRARPGHHVLKVCRAEACQALGGRALIDHLRSHLQVDFGETTADGTFTLEEVFCLGNCGLGPSLMVDGTLHGRVDAGRLDALLADHRRALPGEVA